MSKEEIIIVSGIPRSGTSMMMTMLQAGGMQLFYDGIRKPDKNNPNGYFEYEKVKKLKEDNLWLLEARGMVIKVLFNFLYFLPQTYKFKIIFMQRAINEVLASQNKMLSTFGKSNPESDKKMSILFKKEIEKSKQWLMEQSNIATIYISYNQIIENPEIYCENLNEFVSANLNIEEMVKTIDKSLYRNK